VIDVGTRGTCTESFDALLAGWQALPGIFSEASLMCPISSNQRSLTRDRPAAWWCVALLLLSPTAFADEMPNLLTDSFQVALGTFAIDSEPTVQLNGETGMGDKVNFDEALGGGDAQRVRLDGHWRFGDSRRHKVKAIVFKMSRDNSRTIDEEIEWGGEIYPVNAKLQAEFEFAVVEAVYEYAFLRRDNYELDASIGLHYTTLDSSLKATVATPDATVNEKISRSASVDLPLPVVGLRGLWNLSHGFWLDATAQYFALSIDQYDGSLQDYRVLVTWQPKQWLGVGLGYNQFSVDLDIDADSFKGSLDWTYRGPMIYYSVSF
jgi:hypothetical protein